MNQMHLYRQGRRGEKIADGNAPASAVVDNKLEALKMLASSILTEVVALGENRGVPTDTNLDLSAEVRRLEIDLIRCALIRTGGRQRQAARLLKVKPTTLHEKMKRYGILTYTKPGDLLSEHDNESPEETGETQVEELDLPVIS